jgi:hypothetical protein
LPVKGYISRSFEISNKLYTFKPIEMW